VVYQHQSEKIIAVIRAPRKLRIVSHNFYYHFWGQHYCWTGTSI